jgi:hypothetical protein
MSSQGEATLGLKAADYIRPKADFYLSLSDRAIFIPFMVGEGDPIAPPLCFEVAQAGAGAG